MKEFKNIQASDFAPYTYARNLFENLINCCHVRDQRHQVDVSFKKDTKDAAIKEYNALKKECFPDRKIEALVKAAHDKVLVDNKKQVLLTSFFRPVPKDQAAELEEEVHGGVAGGGGVEKGEGGYTTHSCAIKSLFDTLKLTRGREMAKELSSSKGFDLVAVWFQPLLSTVLNLNAMVQAATKFNCGQSESAALRARLDLKVVELKKIFSDATALILEDVDVEGMTRMESRAAQRRRDTDITLKIEEAIQAMTEGREDLEKFRGKLQIRWDQLKQKGRINTEKPKVTVKNAFYSTEECLSKLNHKFDEVGARGENKVDGMSREDFSNAITFFAGMERDGQEYALPNEFGTALGRIDTKHLADAIKAVIAWLPVGVLHVRGQDVLIDTCDALSDAVKISRIMAALKPSEKTLYVPRKTGKEKVSGRGNKAGKRPRRAPTTMKPYIEDAIKIYVESSGVAAQERRRHESGTIGFSIPQVPAAIVSIFSQIISLSRSRGG